MNRALRILLEALVIALAVWQIVAVATAMRYRFGVPFDLEWMEGATLLTGLRAAQGLPFYAAPAADYIPFIYPPLYAWILGALSHVTPLGYGLGRGVSIACTGAAAIALLCAARREGARWPLALGVAALFIGCYEEGGTFYDLVRIDPLAIALTGTALVLGRGESRGAAVVSGLALAVAFTAKHNMALLGLPIVLWRWRALGWRNAAVFVAASAGPALAFTIGMQVATDGYFLTYLLDVPSNHGMVMNRLLPNLQRGRVEGAQAEIVRALPYTTLLGLLTLPFWSRSRSGAYWAGVSAVALVMASLMRSHQGGFLNVLIPVFWVLPLWAVLAEQGVARATRGRPIGRWAPHAFALAMAAQLWEGRGNLQKFLPTDADARAASALVEELRGLPEPILMPHGPYYPVLAGKAPSFALISLWDIDHAGGPLTREARVIDRAVSEQHWATVITPDLKFGHGLPEHYTRAGRLKARAFGTRTGWGVRFGWVWHPTRDAATPFTPVGPTLPPVAP